MESERKNRVASIEMITCCSRSKVQESIDRYFKAAQDTLQDSEDKLELCLLFTHCFEDHYEADGHSKKLSPLQYATRVFKDGIEDMFNEGKYHHNLQISVNQ